MRLIMATAAFTAFLAAQANGGDAIRDRLDKYLIEYEPQLSSLVADERMTQRDGASRLANTPNRGADQGSRDHFRGRVRRPARKRRLAWVPTRGQGQQQDDRRRRSVARGAADRRRQGRLRPGAAAARAERRAQPRFAANDKSSEPAARVPASAQPHRLRHRLDGMEKIRGINTARMVFEEHSTPTIIQRPDGGDMQSLISAWVEPDTGRLLRAQVKTRDARIGVLPFDNVIWVDFRPDEKLGLLVPYEMKEEFFAGPLPRRHRHGALHELPAVQDRRAHRPAAAMKASSPSRAAGAARCWRRSRQQQDVRTRGSMPTSTDYEPKLSELIADEVHGAAERRGGNPRRRHWPARIPHAQSRKSPSSPCRATPAGWASGACSRSAAMPVDDTLGSLNAVLAGGAVDDYARARHARPTARGSTSARRARSTFRICRSSSFIRDTPIAFRSGWPARNGCAARKPTKLVLVENVTPTIIRAFDSSDMRSIVSALVEPETGQAVAGRRDHARSAADQVGVRSHRCRSSSRRIARSACWCRRRCARSSSRARTARRTATRLHELSPLPDLSANRASVRS